MTLLIFTSFCLFYSRAKLDAKNVALTDFFYWMSTNQAVRDQDKVLLMQNCIGMSSRVIFFVIISPHF